MVGEDAQTIYLHPVDNQENSANLAFSEGDYRFAIAPTIDWNIFIPSVQPSSGSAERSGWGIIPNTFPPGLQIPAMLSKDPLGLDPLGLAAELTSPSAEQ